MRKESGSGDDVDDTALMDLIKLFGQLEYVRRWLREHGLSEDIPYARFWKVYRRLREIECVRLRLD